MHRRPRWLWIGARVGKRIDVIQILDSARQRHLAGPLYLGRNGRLLSDRAFFSTVQTRQHTPGLVPRRESNLPSFSLALARYIISPLSLFSTGPHDRFTRTHEPVRRTADLFSFESPATTNRENEPWSRPLSRSLTLRLRLRALWPAVPFSPCLFLPPHVPFASTGSTTKQRLTWIPWSRWTDILFLHSSPLLVSVPLRVCFMRTRKRERERGREGEREKERERERGREERHTANKRGKLSIYFRQSDDSWRREKTPLFCLHNFSRSSIDRSVPNLYLENPFLNGNVNIFDWLINWKY